MSNHDTIVQVRCFAAPEALRRSGIRCFVQVVIDGTLSVDGLAVRRTERGEYVITWPERRDAAGRAHAIVRLLDSETRTEVERAVLVEAARGGWVTGEMIRCEKPSHKQAGAT